MLQRGIDLTTLDASWLVIYELTIYTYLDPIE